MRTHSWRSCRPCPTGGSRCREAGRDCCSSMTGAWLFDTRLFLCAEQEAPRTIGNFWADLIRGINYILLPISLVAALAIGFVAQRTRFCTVGAFRDLILSRGGSGDVAVMYRAFRGRDPIIQPLLEERGLTETK